MSIVDTFDTICRNAAPLVDAADTRRSIPTPNTDFDAGALVSHMLCVLDGAAARVAGGQGQHDPNDPPDRPADLSAQFRASASAAATAFRAEGALDSTVMGPVGEMTGEMLLHFPMFDLFVHTWDLAQALETTADYPDEIVTYIRAWAERTLAHDRPPFIDPAVAPPAGASAMDELAAFTGRHPLR